jgi:hypothetical protein
MKRMLGFGADACSPAGLRTADEQKPGDYRAKPHHLRCRCFICHLLVDELDDYSPARAETEVIVVEAKSAVYSLLAKMPTM